MITNMVKDIPADMVDVIIDIISFFYVNKAGADLCAGFSYRKIKISIRVGLISQGKVPPLVFVGGKTGMDHNILQQSAVLALRIRKTRVLIMTDIPEEVKVSSHINVAGAGHIKERQVNCGTSRMPALGTDILLVEEDALVEVGIEELSHQSVWNVFRPTNEVVDGFLGAVGVVDFQAIT